jgi:hypothetical protein
MEKQFTVAGYSRGPDGEVKFRVANDLGRAQVLARNGHSEVALRVLPIAMTKSAAEQFLNSTGARKELGGLKACVDRAIESDKTRSEPALTEKQKAEGRAEFNRQLKAAYEAN